MTPTAEVGGGDDERPPTRRPSSAPSAAPTNASARTRRRSRHLHLRSLRPTSRTSRCRAPAQGGCRRSRSSWAASRWPVRLLRQGPLQGGTRCHHRDPASAVAADEEQVRDHRDLQRVPPSLWRDRRAGSPIDRPPPWPRRNDSPKPTRSDGSRTPVTISHAHRTTRARKVARSTEPGLVHALDRLPHNARLASANARSSADEICLTALVTLIGWRADRLRAPSRINSPVSREGAFLVNNLHLRRVRADRDARRPISAGRRGLRRPPRVGRQASTSTR